MIRRRRRPASGGLFGVNGEFMTRDETIALFCRCEEARREKLIELGFAKMKEEWSRSSSGSKRLALREEINRARRTAHEAAKTIWNAWADSMIESRKALELRDIWKEQRRRKPGFFEQRLREHEPRDDWLVRHHEDMRDWIESARIDFSELQFATLDTVNASLSVSLEAWRFVAGSRLLMCFGDGVDFSGYTFPGEADFREAMFLGDVSFSDARFDDNASFVFATFEELDKFDGAEFCGDASFRSAQFKQECTFIGVTFHKYVEFSDCEFRRDVSFVDARFSLDASRSGGAGAGDENSPQTFFWETEVRQDILFNNAEFCGHCWFVDTRFGESAWFKRTQFQDQVTFSQSAFNGLANFVQARFRKSADFRAILGKRGFDLSHAYFAAVPDFNQAHFEEGPRLDNLRLDRDAKPDGWRRFFWNHDPDLAAKFRALKRLAIENHDHEREREFFKGELRSLRGDPSKLLPSLRRARPPDWAGAVGYVLSILYEVFADFGASILRPAMWWLMAAWTSMAYYLSVHLAQRIAPQAAPAHIDRPFRVSLHYCWDFTLFKLQYVSHWIAAFLVGGSLPVFEQHLACAPGGGDGDAVSAAATLALANGVAHVLSETRVKAAHACLYGLDWSFGPIADNEIVAKIPSDVILWSTAHTMFSLTMLFLLILALRNHFRIQ
jgi:hypothetical protein